MRFSILLCIFLPKFDQNAIIYIFTQFKIYGSFLNIKLLKIKHITQIKRILTGLDWIFFKLIIDKYF